MCMVWAPLSLPFSTLHCPSPFKPLPVISQPTTVAKESSRRGGRKEMSLFLNIRCLGIYNFMGIYIYPTHHFYHPTYNKCPCHSPSSLQQRLTLPFTKFAINLLPESPFWLCSCVWHTCTVWVSLLLRDTAHQRNYAAIQDSPV